MNLPFPTSNEWKLVWNHAAQPNAPVERWRLEVEGHPEWHPWLLYPTEVQPGLWGMPFPVFNTPGTYTVRVVAENVNGATASEPLTVTLVETPAAPMDVRVVFVPAPPATTT